MIKLKPNINISDYRYERKFFITSLSKFEVENIVKLHPAIFSEIFHERFVNNIYFDSINLNNYFDNIDGSTNKIKIRIRWYGDLFGLIEKPILEIKKKLGLLGKKVSIPLKPFELSENTKMSDILYTNKKLNGALPIDFKSLRSLLLNRYSRKYYFSCNRNFRITIDTDQSFYRTDKNRISLSNKIEDNNTVILELKYEQEYESIANCITTKFPFRITKSSKYVDGIQKVYQIAF